MFRAQILGLAILLVAFELCMAMKDDIKYTNSGGGKRIARFAFKAGGTARGNVTLTTVN